MDKELMEQRANDLRIKRLEPNGDDQPPKYQYRAEQYGQVNFLKVKCREQAICVDSFSRDVQIFSRRKLPKFLEIIEESLEYIDKPEPELMYGSTVYRDGQRVLCVMVKKEKDIVMYVVESNLPDVMSNVYKRLIPKPSVMKLYDKKRELVEAILNEEGLVI